MLEIESIRFRVIRQVRPKLACACCDRIVQAEAPSRPIVRGVAGPGLLAHVLVSKFGDHLVSRLPMQAIMSSPLRFLSRNWHWILRVQSPTRDRTNFLAILRSLAA